MNMIDRPKIIFFSKGGKWKKKKKIHNGTWDSIRKISYTISGNSNKKNYKWKRVPTDYFWRNPVEEILELYTGSKKLVQSGMCKNGIET